MDPFCVHCLEKSPKMIVLASVCDHISPDFDDFRGFLSGKTQSLCRDCHQFKTSAEDIPLLLKKEKTTIEVKDV